MKIIKGIVRTFVRLRPPKHVTIPEIIEDLANTKRVCLSFLSY